MRIVRQSDRSGARFFCGRPTMTRLLIATDSDWGWKLPSEARPENERFQNPETFDQSPRMSDSRRRLTVCIRLLNGNFQ